MPTKKRGNFDYLNFAYGLGAAIVIVGAMFKFLGWEYANQLFLIGLTTEAIIFIISGIEFKVTKDRVRWERVFPQLDPKYRGEKKTIDLIDAQELYFKNTKEFVNSISSFNATMNRLNDAVSKIAGDADKIGTSIERIEQASEKYENDLSQLSKRIENMNEAFGKMHIAAGKEVGVNTNGDEK